MDFLKTRYGKMQELGDELIKDNVSDAGESGSVDQVATSRWKKDDET